VAVEEVPSIRPIKKPDLSNTTTGWAWRGGRDCILFFNSKREGVFPAYMGGDPGLGLVEIIFEEGSSPVRRDGTR